jgi:NADH-quinone oxidoreductase subunit A
VDLLLREYLPILVLLAIAAGLGLVLILAAAVLAVRNPDPEKVSAYECGFNAFDDARMKFDVRFYLVSILFIIFDLKLRSCSLGRWPLAKSAWRPSGR